MDTRNGHRVGVTPMVMRLAASFLAQGVGTYEIDHPEYDSVDVSVVQRWDNYTRQLHTDAYRMLMRVTFLREEKRIRWVEFNITITGAGGAPTFKVVDNDDPE